MIKCKVDNSRWMWSLENARLTVTSPTGRSITLHKWHLGPGLTEELMDLVQRLANSKEHEIELTREEMKMLLTYPKVYVPKLYKAKPTNKYWKKRAWLGQ